MGVDNRQRAEEHGRGPRRRPQPGMVINCEQPACALSAAPHGPGWAS